MNKKAVQKKMRKKFMRSMINYDMPGIEKAL